MGLQDVLRRGQFRRCARAVGSRRQAPKLPRPGSRIANRSQDPFENPNTPFVPRTESLFSRIEPGALGSSLVLVALIGVIGYGGWSVLQEVQKVQFTPVDQAPGVGQLGRSAGPDASGIGTAMAETAGLTPPPAEALDRLYRPQALDVPVLTARDGPIAALDPQIRRTRCWACRPRNATP